MTKEKMLSLVYTFLGGFLTVIAVYFVEGKEIAWTVSVVSALLLSAVRAGVKAILTSKFSPELLGGKK